MTNMIFDRKLSKLADQLASVDMKGDSFNTLRLISYLIESTDGALSYDEREQLRNHVATLFDDAMERYAASAKAA